MNDPSKCWDKAKEYMNWGSGSGPPNQLQINGELISKASSIATAMNEYFIGKVLAIRNEIKSIPPNLVKCYEIMRCKKCKLWLGYITQDRVTKLLKSLKKSKSCAIDGLDSYSLQVSAEYISGPLHHLITLSMMQQKFPSAWKYSKIIPLHKKASRLDRQNYRPVAILSPLSKIVEKIVFQQIDDLFTRNKIFTDRLHGYRNNRSTHTTLLTMYDRWVRAAARGDLSGAVLIDLSAAFDLVDHEILKAKLKVYGLQSDFISWINSYLSERFQALWGCRSLYSVRLESPRGVIWNLCCFQFISMIYPPVLLVQWTPMRITPPLLALGLQFTRLRNS